MYGTMARALLPVAVQENARWLIAVLGHLGYTQSDCVVACPKCQCRYLLFLDGPLSQPAARKQRNCEQVASDYFQQKVLKAHDSAHDQEKLCMELADLTSTLVLGRIRRRTESVETAMDEVLEMAV